MAVTATRPQISEEQLVELLGLLDRSDTVELKLTVPEASIRKTAFALGMDPLDGQIRMVTFFDTPDLALNKAGIVVRARRIQGRAGDSVIKLRPAPPDVSPELRADPEFGVEVDAMPGGFVCSGRLKCPADNAAIWDVITGKRAIRKLFTKRQRALYEQYAPAGIALDDLAVLGPLFIVKMKFAPVGMPTKLVAELWLYPDGSRVFELSTKCAAPDAFTLAARTRAFMSEHGVDLSGQQQAKTSKALRYFSTHLDG